MIKIELLYFDGCPSWKIALENLRSALISEDKEFDIALVNIASAEDAESEQFLGSPSIRVDGENLWPEKRLHYRLSCNVYPTPDGLQGSPTIEMIKQQFRKLDLIK